MRHRGIARTATVFCIVFVMLFGGVSVAASSPQPVDAGYASYQNIPGVTAEDIAAVEALKKEYGAFVYGMT